MKWQRWLAATLGLLAAAGASPVQGGWDGPLSPVAGDPSTGRAATRVIAGAAPVGYQPRQEGVGIRIDRFEPIDSASRYQIDLGISGASRIRRIDVYLVDTQTGARTTWGRSIDPQGQGTLRFERDASRLEADRKYQVVIQAVDSNGVLIQKERRVSGQDDPHNLATWDFQHQPPPKAPVVITIDSVTPDPAFTTLTIDLDKPNVEEPIAVDGTIVDQAGPEVGSIARTPLISDSLTVPLPEAVRRSTQAGDYTVMLRFYQADGTRLTEATKEFKLTPPPPPALVERIGAAISANPVVGWTIAGIVLVVILLYILIDRLPRRRPKIMHPHDRSEIVDTGRRPAQSQDAPTSDVQIIPSTAGTSRPGQAKLTVESKSGDIREYQLISAETSIGRDPRPGVNGIVLDDGSVSRRHAVIKRRGENYFLAHTPDVKNPTRLNGRQFSSDEILHHGDQLKMGSTRLVFLVEEDATPDCSTHLQDTPTTL